MYVGSYTDYTATQGLGIALFSTVALLIMAATLFILPIVTAVRFNCTNKKMIIILHIVLFFILGSFNSIVSFILIAVNKKNSRYYEDTGKNIAWFQIGLYALSILALFMPFVKTRSASLTSSEYESRSLFDFLSENVLFTEDGYKQIRLIIFALIGVLLLGLVLNLIFRDARKLLAVNVWIPAISSIVMYAFTNAFFNAGLVPGFAFEVESFIIIVWAITSYIVAVRTSYVDN